VEATEINNYQKKGLEDLERNLKPNNKNWKAVDVRQGDGRVLILADGIDQEPNP
jgi:hypothetical protein